MNNVIYGLYDPISNHLMYIGKTRKNLKTRYRQHLLQAKTNNKTKKEKWIYNLLLNNLKPDIKIIDSTAKTNEELNQLERFYIEYCLFNGHILTNITTGGNGGTSYVSLETRKKLSDRNKKYKVIDLQTLEIFPSMMSVCYKYNFSTGQLSDHLNKKSNISIHGKFFKWLPINIKNIEKWANKQLKNKIEYKEFKDKKKYQNKPILCVNTGKIYESTKQAAAELNFSTSGICDVLKGNKRSIFGLIFKYADR